MSQVITKRSRISHPRLRLELTLSGGAWVGLPPLVAMFNSTGNAYAAEPTPAGKVAEAPIESRFVLWLNGNGIPDRYSIPAETGARDTPPPRLPPPAPLRNDSPP